MALHQQDSEMNHKILLTGIKPTGQPHLGNYIGAIRPALKAVQEFSQSFLFIADGHSLTTVQNSSLQQSCYEVLAVWLACGADPDKTIIYRQSDIPEIFQLYWILACVTPKGLLNRAHSYKDYVQKNSHRKKEQIDFGINMGVFNYPLLMAADILLFSADSVPVGQDQLQHLEMTRDMAGKFNQTFKTSLLKSPLPLHEKAKNSLPGLDGRKMSKSYNNDIPLFCPPEVLKKKIMKIKTDSLPPEAPKNPDTSILFSIYQAFATPQQSQAMRDSMKQGLGWGEMKLALFELLDHYFSKKRKIYEELISDKEKLNQILTKGAGLARTRAQTFLKKIKQAAGLL